MKHIKTYVLMVLQVYPKGHLSYMGPTFFAHKILTGEKIHTIRKNLKLWQKRAEEINAGRAVLSVRYWDVIPYGKGSKQIEICKYDKIGIQSISFNTSISETVIIDRKVCRDCEDFIKLAHNDGLRLKDFISWFQHPVKDGVIIHFTDFRYNNE